MSIQRRSAPKNGMVLGWIDFGLNETAGTPLAKGGDGRLLSESIFSESNPSDRRFSDRPGEPSPPTHDRGHDGPQSVAGYPIMSQRGSQVQPIF